MLCSRNIRKHGKIFMFLAICCKSKINMKKELTFILCIILLSGIVSAQSIKIDLPSKEDFNVGEKIILKISLLDSQNIPISTDIKLTFENADKTQLLEKTVQTNKIVEVDLGNVSGGSWNVIATYQNIEEEKVFLIQKNEEVKLSLEGDNLIIENIGNTIYEETIDIIIGNTIEPKEVKLNIGEKTNFRLIAPDGTYTIKVSDGKTTLSQGEVKLTGEAIGILDERMQTRALITGARSEDAKPGFYNSIKSNKFIYFFVASVIGAVVLLAIERRYRKKLGER